MLTKGTRFLARATKRLDSSLRRCRSTMPPRPSQLLREQQASQLRREQQANASLREQQASQSKTIERLETRLNELSDHVDSLSRCLPVTQLALKHQSHHMTRAQRFAIFNGGVITNELMAFVVFMSTSVGHNTISLSHHVCMVDDGHICFDRLPYHLVNRQRSTFGGFSEGCDLPIYMYKGMYTMKANEENFRQILNRSQRWWNSSFEAYRIEQRAAQHGADLTADHKFF